MPEQPTLLPTGHTSVMAARAPETGADLDYFPTPPWAARAGGELIQRLDPGPWSCWEPAAGGGHMAHGLRDHFKAVLESDIADHDGRGVGVIDFMSPEALLFTDRIDWIVTNPPFILGEAFVRRSVAIARRGVAMLLRLAFIEGNARHQLHHIDCPLTVLAPFSERVPMVKGRWDPDASSATAYAWFIYRKGHTGPAAVWPVPPGTKARLSRTDDLVRFCGADEQVEMFAQDDAA